MNSSSSSSCPLGLA
ncbi:unnamed protein product, partial [Rotaria magnacalcarata]